MKQRRRKENPYKWLFVVLGTLLCIYLLGTLRTDAAEATPFEQPVKLRCTCYVDDGLTASGKQTRLGIMAAKQEWVGYTACINRVNEDGSIGEFIGYFEILDTGYGRETGLGESQIFKGRTLGTIETGETIDIWMPTMHAAEEWVDTYGDYVYIKLIKAEG